MQAAEAFINLWAFQCHSKALGLMLFLSVP